MLFSKTPTRNTGLWGTRREEKGKSTGRSACATLRIEGGVHGISDKLPVFEGA
jgi:hypothetical protein